MRQIAVILLLIVTGVASATTLEDIRDRIRNEYLQQSVTGDAEIWSVSLSAAGQWEDIDYSDRSRALWQLEKHLDRIIDMALQYEGGSRADKTLLEASLKALTHWYEGRYRNDNWWYAKIGMPRRILAIAYILDGDLPRSLRDSVANTISIIDSNDYPARPGGDRIQVVSNHVKALLWQRDFNNASRIIRLIEAEAAVALNEETMYDAAGGSAVRNSYRPSGRGVQSDLSFHHRGDRVNTTLTYGLELPEFFSYWAGLLRGTDNRFSDTSLHFVIDYYLDGVCRHLVRGRFYEPSILNRELSRPGSRMMSPRLAESLLEISEGYRIEELRHYADVQKGVATDTSSYAAYFSQSDYFAFSRPQFHTAVRFSSYRNANQEATHNSEGLRNHFRGDGACMLSVTGREYNNIAPCFDFRKVPGVTAPLIPYEPLEAWGSVQILDCPTKFAVAVSDSLYGAVAMDFISPRSALKARKAWFFFDNEYLCLGSNISCSLSDSIVTTVEQCLSANAKFEQGRDNWYFHGGNGYHIIDGIAEASIEHRRGSWRNCAENVAYADESVEHDIFTLTIGHGVKPTGVRYAYAVTPNCKSDREHTFSILANNADMQAVATHDGRLVYIVFYAPGSIDTPAGRYHSDEPCIIMVRDGNLTMKK